MDKERCSMNSSYQTFSKLLGKDVKGTVLDRLIVRKYLLTLKSLESKIFDLSDRKYTQVELDNFVTYFVGVKLITDYINNPTKEVRFKLKKEIFRLENFQKEINSNYSKSKLTQESAKRILLRYMSDEDITEEMLEIYPTYSDKSIETDDIEFININQPDLEDYTISYKNSISKIKLFK